MVLYRLNFIGILSFPYDKKEIKCENQEGNVAKYIFPGYYRREIGTCVGWLGRNM